MPRFLRAAVKDLQRLGSEEKSKAESLIEAFARGYFGDTKALRGFHGLVRTRRGDLRVVWKKLEDDVLIVRIDKRSEVYERSFPDMFHEPADPEDYSRDTDNQPTYQWKSSDSFSWLNFIVGGYRTCPVLTSYQEKQYENFQEQLTKSDISGTWLIQSAPGTGKTVCAALFASRVHENWHYPVSLIVPQELVADLKSYPAVINQLQQAETRFFLGTFRDWIQQQLPEVILATPNEELEALKNAARLRLSRWHEPDLVPDSFEYRDAVLYQASVLYNAQQNKDVALTSDLGRIEVLKKIPKENWQKALDGKLCRLDAALQLTQKALEPPPGERSVIFIDESQDYLLAELEAMFAVREQWKKSCPTCIAILGDLNQRIQPAGFTWDRLPVKCQPIELLYNYRNSRHILEFANKFIGFAQDLARQKDDRHLPPVTEPQNTVEEGEAVRLVIYPNFQEALIFLDKLSTRSFTEESEQRYLLLQLIRQPKVLWPKPDNLKRRFVVLTDRQAKGREFDCCIAFQLFAGSGDPTFEESCRWYTLLTRARTQLLLVITQEEIKRIGEDYFRDCEQITPEVALDWVAADVSDIEFGDVEDLETRLLDACMEGKPFWDTYAALESANINLEVWEKKAIEYLRIFSPKQIKKEIEELLAKYKPIGQATESHMQQLHICLLVSAGLHWEAIELLERLEDIKTRRDIIKRIANYLEYSGFPLESARVKRRLGQPWPNDYPFPEIAKLSGDVLDLLCDATIEKIHSTKRGLSWKQI